MKKIILLTMIIIVCVSITGCVYTNEQNLNMTYDNTTHACIFENISDREYEEIVVKISLKGKDGFKKEIEKEIGDLKEGEKASFEITGISEETKIESVVFEKFDYYVNPWTDIILPCIIGIGLFIFIIIIAVITA